MVSKKELEDYYNLIDEKYNQLLKSENYWNKCNPCKNHGECCKNSKSWATESEWEVIRTYLSKINQEDSNILLNNWNNGINCPFRFKSKCLIHKVRPSICRITPYFASIDNVHVLMPNDTCKQKLFIKDIKVLPESDLIEVKVDDKVIKCINIDSIKNVPTYKKLVNETSRTMEDWIEGHVS